ncbi:T9SS C-terminal target domain-containing protein [candidate division KSB1 bacterium]|nr:MAG: T9SS C-terminal target domain-containing protein [candidate division KSB1 bacterium]
MPFLRVYDSSGKPFADFYLNFPLIPMLCKREAIMKRATWLGCCWMTAMLGMAVWASRPSPEDPPFPNATMNRDNPYGCSGRPLYPHEQVGVQRACDSIASRGLMFIYRDADNVACTLYTPVVADVIRQQMQSGRMKAETLATKGRRGRGFVARTQPDSLESTWGDLINISADLLSEWAIVPSKTKYLEEVLIHEYIHKRQDSLTCRNLRHAEADAWRATMTWKDTMHWNPGDQHYKDCRHTMLTWESRYASGTDYVRFWNPRGAGSKLYGIIRDTSALGEDTLISFDYGDITRHSYPLGATRGSDLMILSDYLPFGPGHHLAMVFGKAAGFNVSRILCFNISDDGIIGPTDTLDFGSPIESPMCFYAAAQSDDPGLFFVLDTLNDRIVNLLDTDADRIPDFIVSVYGDAAWPGFSALQSARGIAPTEHPFLGPGLTCNEEDVDFPDMVYPYGTVCFLPDPNGDFLADALLILPTYEFLTFMPALQEPLPRAGDASVSIYGTWQHAIAVHTCDSLADTLYQLIGSVQMTHGINAVCALSAPLGAGQFIIPVDLETGERPLLPTEVGISSGTDRERSYPLPKYPRLHQNYPNPFNAATMIAYDLPADGKVTLRVYDIVGRESAVLKDGFVEAGSHRVMFDGSGLASGIYFIRLDAGGITQTRKFLVLK